MSLDMQNEINGGGYSAHMEHLDHKRWYHDHFKGFQMQSTVRYSTNDIGAHCILEIITWLNQNLTDNGQATSSIMRRRCKEIACFGMLCMLWGVM